MKDTEDGRVKMAIKEGEDLIRGYGWANESRLMFVQDPDLDYLQDKSPENWKDLMSLVEFASSERN